MTSVNRIIEQPGDASSAMEMRRYIDLCNQRYQQLVDLNQQMSERLIRIENSLMVMSQAMGMVKSSSCLINIGKRRISERPCPPPKKLCHSVRVGESASSSASQSPAVIQDPVPAEYEVQGGEKRLAEDEGVEGFGAGHLSELDEDASSDDVGLAISQRFQDQYSSDDATVDADFAHMEQERAGSGQQRDSTSDQDRQLTVNVVQHRVEVQQPVYASGERDATAEEAHITQKKLFACSTCSYRTCRKHRLVVHERTHSGEKPFACSQCSYRCARKGDLVRHEHVHTGERPFACSQCSYRASRKRDLVVHEWIHSGEKPFACCQCSYRSTRKTSLITHQRTAHSDEKPFSCPSCSYRAADRSHLVKHQRRMNHS